MSRLGKKGIEIPAKTEVKINGDVVTVKGPMGELSKTFKKIWILPHRLLAITLWGLLILHLIKTWILS